jgi:beta-barrel assembly-enhancing protease
VEGARHKTGRCGYHSSVKPKTLPAISARQLLLRRSVAALCASLALAAPLGQAQPSVSNLPTLGDTERGDLSPIMERKLGEEIMRDIRRDNDYLDDDIILEYLNNFGNNLVSARPGARGETGYDFFFFAVRDPMLNAFALPGGFVAVHSALLLAAQTESELASVMSHEIGHVVQRHIARQIGQQRQDALIPLAAMVLAALAARSSPDASMALFTGGQGLAIQRQLNFSRDAEREADRVGFQIMSAAGYDTSGMVAFFGRLQTASRAYTDLTPAYLRSHPLTSERIADIQARIREAPYHQRADSFEFQLMRARTRVLQDEGTQGRIDAQAAFDSQLAQPSRQQQAAAQYGLAFLALKKGELDKARTWLEAARATIHAPPPAGSFSSAPSGSDGEAVLSSLDLEIKLAPGQPDTVVAKAVKQAEQAYQRYPLARGIARQYAEAMLAAHQLDPAVQFLREQVQLYRQEPKTYELLAKVYAAQNKLALQHIALAESYALTGGVLSALDQLTIARKAPDASFYDLAVIDARERDLKERRRDELKDAKKSDKE